MNTLNETEKFYKDGEFAGNAVKMTEVADFIKGMGFDVSIVDESDEYCYEDSVSVKNNTGAVIKFSKDYGGMFMPSDHVVATVEGTKITASISENYAEKITAFINENMNTKIDEVAEGEVFNIDFDSAFDNF